MTGLPVWAVVVFVLGAVLVIAWLATFMLTHVPQPL